MQARTVLPHKFGTRVSGSEDRFKILDAVAASASAGARTAELKVAGYARLVLAVDFTRSAGTAVVITPTYSLDGGTTYASFTSEAVAAGAATVSPYVVTRTVSLSDIFGHALDVRGMDRVKLLFAVTGGGASDLLTVYATGAVGI